MFRFVLALSFALPMGAKAQWTVFNLHPAGAASWVNLHPTGAYNSQAYGVHDGEQAGYASVSGSGPHASHWSGTAASWVDLHRFLPRRFGWSYATSIWHDAKYVYVVGSGHDPTAQRDEALMWRRRR